MTPVIEKIAIIGSGPAGWTAAIYAARAGLAPVVFEGALTAENQEAGRLPMGQLATTSLVENYPGFPAGDLRAYLKDALSEERQYALPLDTFDETAYPRGATGPAIVELMRRQAENFGTRVISEDVVKVDFSHYPYVLIDSNGEARFAESVIVATGASARWLGLDSETRFKNNGVSACAVCDGALPRFREAAVAVVGGGDVACEDALYMTRFASRVYLIHRRDELRASKTLAARVMENSKITPIWNSVVDEILGDDERGVAGVRVRNVKGSADAAREFEVSGVFVAIGRRPNVEFLNGALELTASGVVKRPKPFSTETSVHGVFVAGDVADDRYRQGIVAAGSGACAALDAEKFLLENSPSEDFLVFF